MAEAVKKIKVKFVGHKHPLHPKPDEYRGASGEWKKGDIKEVEEGEAARLIADFKDEKHGAAFEKA